MILQTDACTDVQMGGKFMRQISHIVIKKYIISAKDGTKDRILFDPVNGYFQTIVKSRRNL